MTARKPRADAQRNRENVLAAADALFARHESARSVSMDDVAAAAGVGKGTLFRRFGDRTGLIRAVFEARTDTLRQAVEHGPAPLGPRTEPRRRVLALLDALLCFKLDNRHLSLALEEAGSGSPYQAAHYTWWHGTLRDTLRRLPSPETGPDAETGRPAAKGGPAADGGPDAETGPAADGEPAATAPDGAQQPLGPCDFTAHALLAATRADLVEHLVGPQGVPPDILRARLAAHVARVLDAGTPPGATPAAPAQPC
ncbi:TetR family transcriptional regulator [Streptomyces armeniacus]|uniref:TetR family transcriptional regulator n=1 Tax=Streptomyces armeniacus TaxID=83291 RepID=A0A345XJH7_9ACTN|nr:TetR family transcriptional regulator [Streptomyces armeniacus]AXK31793.1 TetR family transcriptional regulator [Streptomyces armeniacus]